MNNDTVEKIKMAVIAVDANPQMAPYMIKAIKRNIAEGTPESVKDFCEAFNHVVQNTQDAPAWMWEIQLLTRSNA